MNKKELDVILENHKKWLNSENEGLRANLRDADLRYSTMCDATLSGADLSGADLRGSYMSDVNLSDANLFGATMCDADLSGADLRYSNLCDSDLRYSNLRDADLSGADLRYSNMRGANLIGATLSGADLRYSNCAQLQCPEEGSFIAWKNCRDGVIVKLLIPEDAKRSSATSRKCRSDKAVVIEIFGAEEAVSKYDKNFIYRVGETVSVNNFDDNRWDECATGIHFFITRKEAEDC